MTVVVHFQLLSDNTTSVSLMFAHLRFFVHENNRYNFFVWKMTFDNLVTFSMTCLALVRCNCFCSYLAHTFLGQPVCSWYHEDIFNFNFWCSWNVDLGNSVIVTCLITRCCPNVLVRFHLRRHLKTKTIFMLLLKITSESMRYRSNELLLVFK